MDTNNGEDNSSSNNEPRRVDNNDDDNSSNDVDNGGDDEYKTTTRQQKTRPANPLDHASIISQYFFWWAYPLLNVGSKRPLDESDLPSLLNVDTSSYNCKKIEQLWVSSSSSSSSESKTVRCGANNNNNNNSAQEEEEDNKKATTKTTTTTTTTSLGRAICHDYFTSMWFAQILLVISMSARIGQALALGLLIEQFVVVEEEEEELTSTSSSSSSNNNTKRGYLWSGILVICGFIFFLTKQRQFFETYRKGMQLRIGLVAAIYSKSLKISSVGNVHGMTSGQVTNLASNDVERFTVAAVTGIYLIWGPIEAIVILVIGLQVIGWAFAAGYVLLFIFIPLQIYLGNRFAYYRSTVASITDARVSLVSQAVAGARVMKMNGWEYQFNDRITNIRKNEIQQIQVASRFKALNEAIYFFTSLVVSVVIFSIHVTIADGTLTSRNVFTTMTLLNILQFTMTKHIPRGIMAMSECYVSTKRIQTFLDLPELPEHQQVHHCHRTVSDGMKSDSSKSDAIILTNVTCYWNAVCNDENKQNHQKSLPAQGSNCLEDSSSLVVALANITLCLKTSGLYCIIGKVGSGKSALLQCIASELPSSKGYIIRNYSSVACAMQDPWIMDGTVRENITMGLPFREEWYNKVVASCGLDADIERFRNNDMTIVGDRGIQCSGGQRTRIGLARAIYRDADLLLLDDPLSAVDTKVARLIYNSAIQNLAVKRGKCAVLVTHQHQFVGNANCILMDNGKIVCNGSYSDCVKASNGALTTSLQTEEGGEHHTSSRQPEVGEDESTKTDDDGDEDDDDEDFKENSNDDAHKESRNTGIIELSTWIDYAKAMGGVWVGAVFFVVYSVTQATLLISIVEIGEWAERPSVEQDSSSWLGIIYGLTAGTVILAIMRAWLSFFFCIKASKSLHDRMTQSVIRAKIEFFDTNPLGRILNRFAADVGISDELLPLTIYDFLVGIFMALGSVVTAIVVLPFILLSLPPIVWYFLRLRRTFVTTTRELKRLEGLGRSPIYAMMSEALTGIATIRANEAVVYFQRKFEAVHDAHTRAYFAFVASSRWFATRMDLIAFVLMSLASCLAVLFHDQGWFNVNPAVLGLALTMLLQLAGTNFPWIVRQSAEIVNQMVSVERVEEYGKLQPEAALVCKQDEELKGWPKGSSIAANGVTVRYRSNLPPALSGVTFEIHSGERVGVVGRTGSGKSSLVQALFRILEAEEGTIVVDGVDISRLGLHKIRAAMSVIPQTPILFSGCTVRENLDPFGVFDGKAIRRALEDVQMIDVVDDMPHGLDSLVAEGGTNFSVGQRQLVCLARAILRKNKILILDEATANCDSHTDMLLQKAVTKSFRGATIISVAHRLDTVIDNDRILVLGDGKIIESGSPTDLLGIKDGNFSSMVENTGEKMAKHLCERALDNEEHKS